MNNINDMPRHNIEDVFAAAADLKGTAVFADKKLSINILKDLSDWKMCKKIGLLDQQISPDIWQKVWKDMTAAGFRRLRFKQRALDENRSLLKKEGVESSAAGNLLLGMGTVLNYPKAMFEETEPKADDNQKNTSFILPSYAGHHAIPDYIGKQSGNVPATSTGQNKVSIQGSHKTTAPGQSSSFAASNYQIPVKRQSNTHQTPNLNFSVSHTGHFDSVKTSVFLLLIGWGVFALNVCYIIFGLMDNSFLTKAPTVLTFIIAACSLALLNFTERFRGYGKLARFASTIFIIWFSIGNATAWYVQHGQTCSMAGATWKFWLFQLAVFILSVIVSGRIGDHQNMIHRRIF